MSLTCHEHVHMYSRNRLLLLARDTTLAAKQIWQGTPYIHVTCKEHDVSAASPTVLKTPGAQNNYCH
jgi:hypothetical protein